MKKIIMAAAILLTTGILTVITKENNTKTIVASKSAVAIDKSILATAD